jgi:hypothetical protein
MFIKKYENAIPKILCKKIINLYKNENISESKNLNEVEINLKNEFWNEIISSISKISSKNIESYFSFYNNKYTESMVILSQARFMHHKEFYFMKLHHDSELEYFNKVDFLRTFIVLIYLNDNFENGELIFPIQKFKITPKTGLMVIFPTSFMYPHMTTPAVGSDRYVLQLSYHINKEIFLNKDYDFH